MRSSLDNKMRMRKFCFCLLLFCLFFSKLPGNHWHSEYWQQFFVKHYESDRVEVSTFARIETGNHFKKTRVVRVSGQFEYKVNNDVELEFHYSYIHGHPLWSPVWRWQHRLEFEANKIFHLPCNNQIITRNRLELRWRQKAKPRPDVRFRHRVMLLIPLNTGTTLKAFSCFNEFFYDLSRGYFDQDRICPCQLTFGISEKVDIDVFLIFRLLEDNKALQKSIVLGTQLNF